MLAVLAAVALVIGGVSAATVTASDDHAALQGSKEPVVEVQAIQPSDTKSDQGNF
ncbi:MAG: hypothetical protein WCA32_21615 [Chromatiaceae bacterium]